MSKSNSKDSSNGTYKARRVTRGYRAPKQVDQERRSATMARVLQRLNRVIGNPGINVKSEMVGLTIETDGKHMSLSNLRELNTIADLTYVYGANYHMLGHVLYTPRSGNGINNFHYGDDYKMAAFHMLEDARVETLLVGRYPNTGVYLAARMLSLLSGSGKPSGDLFPLIHGMKHIPQSVRDDYESKFYFQSDLPEVKRIIDEYRLLALPSDNRKAKKLMGELGDLLAKWSLGDQCMDCSINRLVLDSEEPDENQKGDSDSAQDQDQQRQQSQGDDGDDGDDGDSEDGDQDSDQDSDQDGDQKDGDQKDSKSNSRSSNAAGTAREELQKLLKNRDLQREMQQKQEVVVHGDGHYDPQITQPIRYGEQPADTDMRRESRHMEDELKELVADSEAGWDRRTPSGKLNVARAMHTDDPDEMFDQWVEESEGTDLQVVMLVDNSSSMEGQSEDMATRAAWLIDRAVKQIDGSISSFTFGSSDKVLYPENRKPTMQMIVTGAPGMSTCANRCLLEAEQIFRATKRKNKVLMMVTDGSWSDAPASNEVITRLRAMGVHTALAFLNDWVSTLDDREVEELSHGVDVFHHIKRTSDLVPWSKEVVEQAIRQKIHRK